MQPTENNSQSESYCANLVRGHDRDLYTLALFAPANLREGLFAIYALATELGHIRHMVSEEMIGHIRYAWWRETLEKLCAGTPRPGHPVLEALAPLHLPEPMLMALVEAYAAPYPEAPQGQWEALVALSRHYLSQAAPEALKPWDKAERILTRHQKKYGDKYHAWLIVKLLIAGYT